MSPGDTETENEDSPQSPNETRDLINRIGPIQLERLYRISLRHAHVYVAIPKAANSTIKGVLQHLELQGSKSLKHTTFKSSSAKPHDLLRSVLISSWQLPRQQLRRILFGSAFRRWTVVRHPGTRALSAYLDRFQEDDVLRRQVMKALGADLHSQPSFEEFLEGISRIPDRKRDVHVASQARLTGYPTLQYDSILKFEDLPVNVETLLAELYPNAEIAGLMSHNLSPKKTSAASAVSEHLTDKSRELIRTNWAEDFKAFGYDADSMSG